MRHRCIDENNIVDLYALGRLKRTSAQEFERHFIACGRCVDSLELALAFVEALQRLTRDDPAGGMPQIDVGPPDVQGSRLRIKPRVTAPGDRR